MLSGGKTQTDLRGQRRANATARHAPPRSSERSLLSQRIRAEARKVFDDEEYLAFQDVLDRIASSALFPKVQR
jgi:hypothetical protein